MSLRSRSSRVSGAGPPAADASRARERSEVCSSLLVLKQSERLSQSPAGFYSPAVVGLTIPFVIGKLRIAQIVLLE